MINDILINTTKEFDIYKNNKITEVFKIKIKNFSYNSKIFLDSIKQMKILTGLVTNVTNNEFTFQALSVTTLKEFEKKINSKWSYEMCQNITLSLTNQLIYLLNNKYSFYGYNPETIIVVNEIFFFQISSDYLLPVKKNDILFHSPFSKTFFISPEIYDIVNLPTKINYKCIYYSLGSLIIYLLLKKNIFTIDSYNKEIENNVEDILIPIKGTKLYWFLLRALNPIIEKRTLIYI